ncbi:ABC transporter substrate-binding protein [Wenjunlia tyrosinilytica]|nr:ABC transporter substrate-binding protein [Wenjunlia tyrosinilytica]
MALTVAACGGDKNDSSGSSGGGAVIMGTTEPVQSLDPAKTYDLGSWTVIYNTFQTLLTYEAGAKEYSPDAAEKCSFGDPKTFTCTLKSGQKFSDGSDLTAEDVAFSIKRVVKIADPTGASTLFGSMQSVEAKDAKTVVFHLKRPDATFPQVLTTGAAAIVPSDKPDVYPADKVSAVSKSIGSGVYTLDKYKPKQLASFIANKEYKGNRKPKAKQFVLQFFSQESTLKQAVENGKVDVAYGKLSPTTLDAIGKEKSKGVSVVQGAGADIRYLTFNVKSKPVDNKAVRQAFAQVLDRDAIAKNVYNGNVTPLYSMVPQGVAGATQAFKDKYGAPSKDKAAGILKKAKVKTPVSIDLWSSPEKYGAVTTDEFTEIKRQLEATGLFKVKLDTSAWEQFQKAAFDEDQYPVFGLGWYPDFPDSDNYSSPFLRDGGYFTNNYKNAAVNKQLDKELASSDAKVREAAFAEIQKITAEDVPLLPVWQGKQNGVVRDGVTGVQDTFDPSYIFRFWLVGKGKK